MKRVMPIIRLRAANAQARHAAYNWRMTSPSTALYTTAQVRSLDAQAIASLGVCGFQLMQRAATAALQLLRKRWPTAKRVVVVCGPGNNGGDGFLLAALGCRQGLDLQVLALTAESHGDAATARQACIDAGVHPHIAALGDALPAADVYVDALFGSGLRRAPTGVAAQWIGALNATAAPVLALDVPSGLDSDNGAQPGCAVHAAVTVCFIAWKRGLFTHQAVDCCGDLYLDTLQLAAPLYAQAAPDAALLQPHALPPRARSSHKGDNGHVLVVGGDHGFGGAVRLVGEAALRSGAGLVSVATRKVHVGSLLAARPELMPHAVEDPDHMTALLARASVLAVGPGLGQDAWGKALWQAAMDSALPMVLDADGLNLLAKQHRNFRGCAVVLTPHPGEAARLLDTRIAAVQADRFAAVRELARRFGAIVVLKGAGSLIADPQGQVALCPWGNPGMASGGMGDVLGGVIAALMVQGLSPWTAACTGVGLHARAGDLAAANGQRGLLAGDLFEPLRQLANADDC